jgi:hypothetical protein
MEHSERKRFQPPEAAALQKKREELKEKEAKVLEHYYIYKLES